MKKGFYVKLAWTGMVMNRRLYVPYLLSSVGMVMMYYIISSLSLNESLRGMRGGAVVSSTLNLGTWVIGVFSLLFLFYTNAFLMRRRNKEFGLYNILGMDKGNIGRIIAWESLITAVIGIFAGILFGMLFSKLAELALLNMVRLEISYEYTVSVGAIINTFFVYAAIFVILFINSLFQVYKTKPIELLHSDKVGEKPPRANLIFALIGAVLLAGAYYIASNVSNPIDATMLFFVAVIMVIIGTYLLFITGSVAFCKLLQKNKKYYYNKKHFVSVSSMLYRMKRNGAGLASICILCTMALVTLSTCTSMYFGQEESLKNRYPRNIAVKLSFTSAENMKPEGFDVARSEIARIAAKHDAALNDILDYRYISAYGYLDNNVMDITPDEVMGGDLSVYERMCGVYVIPVEDYNRLFQKSMILGSNEALIYDNTNEFSYDELKIGDSISLSIAGNADELESYTVENYWSYRQIYLVVNDWEKYCTELDEIAADIDDTVLMKCWSYQFTPDCTDEDEIKIKEEFVNYVYDTKDDSQWNRFIWENFVECDSLADKRNSYYTSAGGFLFIGILLSIVFIFGAAMIIYYKQVSEGYEDQSKFEIMKKVGMTERDIIDSVNSQILTVFFAPLIAAGLHLAFAFRMFWLILQLFGLMNINIVIIITVASFVLFALCYMIIYKETSNAYYKIVGGRKRAV